MLDRFTWFRQSAFRYDGDGFTIYIDPWGVTDPRPADAADAAPDPTAEPEPVDDGTVAVPVPVPKVVC